MPYIFSSNEVAVFHQMIWVIPMIRDMKHKPQKRATEFQKRTIIEGAT
jgi:hypothetical protein